MLRDVAHEATRRHLYTYRQKQTGAGNTHSLGLCATEQRHNRPETIKHREEMDPLVRDIYIIEKDFEGNGGSCMPRKQTHTHTQAACFTVGHAK